ncbi:MAG TPA: choice-of-anchor tandem repeat GloVer-containing protein [Verrucomicrobiae bacterium]|nr:choice-of-anchor tandem repeat GloVer-containing protein [Verrucomicrobiae bacterium]
MRTIGPIIAVLLFAAGLSCGASGQTLQTIHQFTGADGRNPQAGLIQASDGGLYGTTYGGGANGGGCVFRIRPNGDFAVINSFGGFNSGLWPSAGLMQGSDGNFYGTTSFGGVNYEGNVFRVSPGGVFSNLYTFGNNGPNQPVAGLVQGSDGNLYGTTSGAGFGGSVFRISPSGTFTNLHTFSDLGGSGYDPVAGLVQGADGNFYGTTAHGGWAYGTVFRISPSGDFTNLYSFTYRDGATPYAGLVQGSDGSFYGTTAGGTCTNCPEQCGTVFRISPSGTLTNLYSFAGPDGCSPQAGLVLGSDGYFYGTTISGGASNNGTVFRVSSDGALTNLYSFTGGADGSWPMAGLLQGSDGNFYGTTYFGGLNGSGTVFKISVPLNPPANQISSVQSDSSGTNLVFGIPSVAGETYQLQFTSDLASGIWTDVPGVSVTNSIGAMMTLTNFGGAVGPQGFYRFAITP